VLENATKLENKVYTLPAEIDQEVAALKLKAMGFGVDFLSEEQKEYLSKTPS
jgi:adenosylhomocysteinase